MARTTGSGASIGAVVAASSVAIARPRTTRGSRRRQARPMASAMASAVASTSPGSSPPAASSVGDDRVSTNPRPTAAASAIASRPSPERRSVAATSTAEGYRHGGRVASPARVIRTRSLVARSDDPESPDGLTTRRSSGTSVATSTRHEESAMRSLHTRRASPVMAVAIALVVTGCATDNGTPNPASAAARTGASGGRVAFGGDAGHLGFHGHDDWRPVSEPGRGSAGPEPGQDGCRGHLPACDRSGRLRRGRRQPVLAARPGDQVRVQERRRADRGRP